MKNIPTSEAAYVREIFSSFQGEGVRSGEKQIFIRFEECHLECEYCDETGGPGKEMSVSDVIEKIKRLEAEHGHHGYVAVTGGEPLLYAVFLKQLLRSLRDMKFHILLETNGILWQAFSEILQQCDLVSMDLKLPSVTKEKDFLEEHAKFVRIAQSVAYYVKIVVTPDISVPEFEEHCCMLASINPRSTVYLIPACMKASEYADPRMKHFLADLQRRASQWLGDVRLGVQLHKVFNIP